MNIGQRFKELRKVVEQATPGSGTPNAGHISQAAAALVLAEVLQGSTITVSVEGDPRKPVYTDSR